MSITEQGSWDVPGLPEPARDDWGDGPAAYEPGERPSRPGDRTPPQDNAAEQSVLGAMMLSKDSIADVSEALRGADFYRPVHEVIFDAIIDLYGRGEPADPITVSNDLQRKGELARIGGAPYLHTLSANVPIAANAGYYAEIVREKAILRRLVDAGTKIVQMGYAGQGQVDDVVDQAQAEVYQVTDRRTSEDYAPLSDILNGVLDEIDAIQNREEGLYGVPDRLRRARRADQRSPQGADDHRRGSSGGRQVHPRARPVSRRVDPQQPHQLLLQPGDGALGDHDAAALGRVPGARSTPCATARCATRTGPSWPARWARSPALRCSSTTRPT